MMYSGGIKAHYPEEFYASILSNASTTEFNNTIAEMKALKIKVKCPDINKSGINQTNKKFILIMEVIFRFIPLLIDEAVLIIKTQIIRGGLGKVKGKMARIKAVVPLIVPLIIRTVKRSEALAEAIVMRGFYEK